MTNSYCQIFTDKNLVIHAHRSRNLNFKGKHDRGNKITRNLYINSQSPINI